MLVATNVNLGAVSQHHMLFSLVLDYQSHAHATTPAGKHFGSGLKEVRVGGCARKTVGTGMKVTNLDRVKKRKQRRCHYSKRKKTLHGYTERRFAFLT